MFPLGIEESLPSLALIPPTTQSVALTLLSRQNDLKIYRLDHRPELQRICERGPLPPTGGSPRIVKAIKEREWEKKNLNFY